MHKNQLISKTKERQITTFHRSASATSAPLYGLSFQSNDDYNQIMITIKWWLQLNDDDDDCNDDDNADTV